VICGPSYVEHIWSVESALQPAIAVRYNASGANSRRKVLTHFGKSQTSMTYCLGIKTHQGLVMASDCRTNAGYDQVNVCRKMHTFVTPGERVFIVLTSGSLSLSQSVLTHVRRDFDLGGGLAAALTPYDAARVLGDEIRRVSDVDRAALERDDYRFNIHLLLGAQIRGGPAELYMIYPQGNPLRASEEASFLQIGECKYGRPILDRVVRHGTTTLDDAARYAMISIDSTMRSNITVGPPIDLLIYEQDALEITRYRRFTHKDPDLLAIQNQWEEALRRAAQELPKIVFDGTPAPE
jgi:putative proteasome-type protease